MGRAGRLLVVAAVLVGSVALGPAARADQDEDTTRYEVATRPTDFTTPVPVDRFDPTRGELVSVTLELDADLAATLRHENIGALPVTTTTAATARLRLSRAGEPWALDAVLDASRTDDLDPFDLLLDFDGASGRTTGAGGSTTTTLVLSAPADLAPFVGSGTLGLTLAGTGSSSTSGATVVDGTTVAAGAEVSVTYHYLADTRPPDPPVLTARPPLFTNDTTPTIAFTAEAGASTSCRLDPPAGTGTWEPCSSPWSVDLGPTATGPHSLSVRATDGAGNAGTPTSAGFTVDLVPPGPSVVVGAPVSPSPVTEPTWSFTSDADTTTTCELDGLGPEPCALSYTAHLAPLADGTHELEIVAIDAAGNRGAPTVATYVLDREAPPAPTFAASPASPASDPTPTWTIAAEAGATLACSVDAAPYLACDAWHTVDLSTALDGAHTLSVRATDAAGNPGPAATATYVLDRWGPAAPAVAGPPAIGNRSAVRWTFTAEAGARFECQLDLAAAAPCDSGAFDATLDLDGVHTFSVRAIDAAGNPGTAATSTYTLDRVAPPPPVVTGRPADPSPDAAPAWSFTIGGTMRTSECRIDGGTWAPCTGSAAFDLAGAPDGTHTFEVRATDRAGNVGEPTASSYVLDRTSPVAPTITGTPTTPGADLAPRWTFIGPVDAVLECSATAAGPWSPCTSPHTVELPTSSLDGSVDLLVRARDAAGNASAAASSTYVLDRTPPSTPTITVAPESPSNRTSASWSFTVDADAEASCSFDAGPWTGCAAGFVALFGEGSDGPHTFAVRSVDEAGNVSPAATGTYVLDTTPPPAPTVVGGPSGSSTDDTPAWTVAGEPGATLECRADDGVFAPCAGTVELDLRGAADGTHSLEVRATDLVGNAGPVTSAAYLLDRSAPAAPTFVTVPSSPGRDRLATWTFTAEAGATTTCALDGGTAVACDGTATADLADAADGEHELVVRATDAAGNTSEAAVGVVVLDTTAPARPVVTGPPSPGNDPAPSWHITADADAGVECAVDGRAFEPCGAVLLTRFDDGLHHVAVRAIDAAGNRSEVVAVDHVVDTVAPDLPRVVRQPTADAWSWALAAPPGAATECSIDGGPWAPCGSVVAATAGNASPRLEVRSIDAAGNRSAVVSAGPAPIAPVVEVGPVAPPVVPPRPLPPPPAAVIPAPVAPAVLPIVAVAPVPVVSPLEAAVAAPPREVVLEPDAPETAIGNLLPVLPPEVAQAIQAAVERGTLPFVLIGVLIAFLAFQDRVDRRDPKLAQAPLRAEPEYLEFR